VIQPWLLDAVHVHPAGAVTVTVPFSAPGPCEAPEAESEYVHPEATVKICGPDEPPPCGALNTVTWAVPAEAVSPAGMAAVNFVSLTNVVVRSLPFQRTTEEEIKPLPFTVSVKAPDPAATLVGEIDVMAGTGFPAPLIMKVMALEDPPAVGGLYTVTCTSPAAVMSADQIVARSCVLLE